MEFQIISKTYIGKNALEIHIRESRKIGFTQKTMLKQLGISQNIISNDPFTLSVNIKNKRLSQLINPDHILREIKDVMKKNGAEENIDYEVKNV